jgi:hypothetical protein
MHLVIIVNKRRRHGYRHEGITSQAASDFSFPRLWQSLVAWSSGLGSRYRQIDLPASRPIHATDRNGASPLQVRRDGRINKEQPLLGPRRDGRRVPRRWRGNFDRRERCGVRGGLWSRFFWCGRKSGCHALWWGRGGDRTGLGTGIFRGGREEHVAVGCRVKGEGTAMCGARLPACHR